MPQELTDRIARLDPQRIPRHVAIIMDGNGRWARRFTLPRLDGHRRGAAVVEGIVDAGKAMGVEVLTLYSFSTENWRRPRVEIAALMHLLKDYLQKMVPKMKAKGVRLEAIGELAALPAEVQETLAWARSETAAGEAIVLNLALSYSGRQEIALAARRIAEEVAAGRLAPEQVDEACVAAHLQTAPYPDPDLMIRTSGEMRLSNFLLWQLAYAELYVTDILWPDFTPADFLDAIRWYQGRERRFGRTGEQVGGGAAPGHGA
ncbi:MAG: isoprenyl transferase [Nitrospirae bacterium]|nr:MAG: isoprenyl transferase [Nitrospirota bacterium]